MRKPAVSIVVPVYNVEQYLRRSMDCLINQTMQDLEFICIDDCSTDNSLSILREYEARDSRFKIISLDKNHGAAFTRNRGLELASGEYLGFVDPDDAIDLNYYEELYKKAKEADYDIVKCVRKTVDVDGQETISNLNKSIKSNIYAFSYEWCTAIYKASIIYDNKITFPDEIRKGQDTVFLNKFILNANSIAVIDNVFYTYYRRNDSLNADTIPIESVKSGLKAFEMCIDNINQSNLYNNNSDAYFFLYERKCISAINTFLFRNNSIEAKKLCAKKFIECFYKCKDIKTLEKIYRYKALMEYVKQKNVKRLTKELIKYKSTKELLEASKNYISYTFLEKIFSIKNIAIYKVITIFGIKLKIKSHKLITDEKIKKLEDKIKQINIIVKNIKEENSRQAKVISSLDNTSNCHL